MVLKLKRYVDGSKASSICAKKGTAIQGFNDISLICRAIRIAIPVLRAQQMLLIASLFLVLQSAGADHIENASASTFYSGGNASALLEVSVIASKSIVFPGSELTYTIQICNLGSIAATNMVIKDSLNSSFEIISAFPEQDEDGLWHISSLGPGECSIIILNVRVLGYDAKFNGISRISGHGYVNIHDDYGTKPQIGGVYNLRNCVFVLANGASDSSACTDITVENIAGTTLKERKHGSGTYNHDNVVGVTKPSRGSIQHNSSLHAIHCPISLTLPQSRALSYNSRWTDYLKTNNQFTGGTIVESYQHANSIEKNSSGQLSWDASVLKTDSEFNGTGYLGYFHQLSPYELDPANRIDFERIKPSFEAREDYAGNFKIKETIDTFDFGASSKKTVSGTGMVSNDKRIGGTSQRTYEYGTGSYASEESVQTLGNYIVKDIRATYLPVNYLFQPGRLMNVSAKWSEGSWSQIKGVSFLGEDVSSADYLNKKSTAQWQSDLESEGNYSGKGRFKVVLKNENDQTDRVRLEEEHIGEYSEKRKIHILNIGPNLPHLYIANDGRLVKDVTKNTIVAKYRIIITNDGYVDLGPIYVRDIFPTGTQFLSSSANPSGIGSGYANWTFTSLPVGQSLKIDLNLNPTKETSELVNRVSVSGGYNHRFITSGNFSTITRNSQNCDRLNIRIYKITKMDSIESNRIAFRIAVENQDNRSIVARVTDLMPNGLIFINSSIEPENMTYGLSWVIMDLAPGEIKYIDCLAQAILAGQFVNRAHIDAYAVDGSGKAPGDANVVTSLDEAVFRNYSSEYDYPSEWEPPRWGFNFSESLFDASSESPCKAGEACPLNTYEEDEGFKDIYGRDDGSDDIYGFEYIP